MFDSLAEKLQATLSEVRGRGTLTEDDVNAAMREIRLALLEADVNFKVVKSFTSAVKERALGADVIGKLNPGQQVVKIVSDELTELMGGAAREISFSPRPPTIIVMAGLQGSGKTTATGKLARYLREQHGSSVAVAACDVYRPAAVDQLIKVGKQAGAEVYEQGTDRDPVEIAKWARDRAQAEGKDVLIIDTSGRLHVDQELMAELANIKKAVKPTDVLLVVDAMTGQDAVNVAEQFAEVVQFDGVVMTKLDGDARGGAALSVKAITGKPIMFASTGEKLDQFERFHPDRMAQRILGMGDVMTLIEKAGGCLRRGAGGRARAQAAQVGVRPRRLPGPDAPDPPARSAPVADRDDPRDGQGAAWGQDRRARVRPDPGDHLVDDPAGAPAPRADQGVAAAAHRQGVGHQRPGGQAADQAIRADAQGDAARSRRAECPIWARLCARPAKAPPSGAADQSNDARSWAPLRNPLTSSADMSVRLRLTRIGSRKNPVWRVVVADQRSKRDGRVIEIVGHYNAQTNPSTIVLDEDRIRDWLARGAQPSSTVHKLLRTQGIQ